MEQRKLLCKDAAPHLSVSEMISIINGNPPGPWPESWAKWDNVRDAHIEMWDFHLTHLMAYPECFNGRGIVIAGGFKANRHSPHGYFPCVWLLVNKLRRMNCQLPIQLWHLGPIEMDPYTSRLLATLGVETVDAYAVQERHACRILCGWEVKLFSTLYSPFKEVLFLDADNCPVTQEPTFLFDESPYKEHGAIFWPDYDSWKLTSGQWAMFGLPHRVEPAFESGQFLINKEQCWRELCMAMWLAEHSDYTFKHVYGDKETFHLAWRKCGTEYAMPSTGPGWQQHTIVQHDFQGRPILFHRVQDKWRLDGSNRKELRLCDEEMHFQIVRELREIWPGQPWTNPVPALHEQEVIKRLAGRFYLYKRIGHDEREIELLANGLIGDGAKGCERRWSVNEQHGVVTLAICGDETVTCLLTEREEGVWKGKWVQHEKMPIELVPIDKFTSAKQKVPQATDDVLLALAKYGIAPPRSVVFTWLNSVT